MTKCQEGSTWQQARHSGSRRLEEQFQAHQNSSVNSQMGHSRISILLLESQVQRHQPGNNWGPGAIA